jgi:hypothetical protein
MIFKKTSVRLDNQDTIPYQLVRRSASPGTAKIFFRYFWCKKQFFFY